MKRQLVLSILIIALFLVGSLTVMGKMGNETLEYKVVSIDTKSWIVTAREVETGDLTKFRLPPSVFKGQTFNIDMEKLEPGKKFSARGPRNTKLNQMVMQDPLQGGRTPARAMRYKKNQPTPSESMAWEIVHVDPRRWVVTARNRQTKQVMKFQAHPEAFTGFRFRANLRGIRRGQGFAIVTPNDIPMENCGTLLNLK